MQSRSQSASKPSALRHLVVVLGDQLDLEAAAFDGFDSTHDAVWMAEVDEESTHVWSSKQRIALFLSGMRHFAQALEEAGRPVHYHRLEGTTPRAQPSRPADTSKTALTTATAATAAIPASASAEPTGLAARLQADLQILKPQRVVLTEPGDWRVLSELRAVIEAAGLSLEVRADRHFFTTVAGFAAYAKARKSLRLEYFYRELRQKHAILMDGDQPAGGQWNFDADNREAFGPEGPGRVPPRATFEPDALTREVINLVNTRFADHPGTLDSFAWPVTRAQALQALQRFVDERLTLFGRYEDALWPGEPWLYHSHLSAALNLKLLTAREVVQAAEQAYRAGRAPLHSVEGFIRQILGWREYVRGIYWTQMPGYLDKNALQAHEALPEFFWTGETDMACLRDALQQTLRHGYAHHIQRLMVLGLYGLLRGVHPQAMHEWFLSVYVDAVEWVELPNTLGMSQFGDGGIMASKPYVASGKYIQRMSNHCQGCRFDPAQSTGPKACPYTTLYWDFLRRHQTLLSQNPRMGMQLKNLQRLTPEQVAQIEAAAAQHRAG